MTKIKIFKNFLQPHKIPKKIFQKLKYIYKFKTYQKELFKKKQEFFFEELGLDRKKGVENLNLTKEKFEILPNGMSSEHEVLFSSISLKKSLEIKNILEIGTYDGNNAFLLSKLFPNSNIDTIDLGREDKNFRNYYNRETKINEFIESRNKRISSSGNINFVEMNSVKLLNHKKSYDLIWIDGAHGYPVVCIDIINAIKLIRDGGLILCDDVFKNLKNSDEMYQSIATYETLSLLKSQKLIDLSLVFKRLSSKYNCLDEERKFIAICKKIN